MEQRSSDQPNSERETDRSNDEAGRRVRDSNATPSPHGGATAEGGAYDAGDDPPPAT